MESALFVRALFTGVILCILIITSVNAFSRPVISKGRCSLSFFNSMRAYDCVGLNLSEIPEKLSSSTEVLDVSLNRIRELTSNSFKNYSDLKKLYLNDNMIMTIEAGTFDGLTNLDTLDLSINALLEVPVNIFHMASLKHLMLARNLRLDINSLLDKALPITAPLQYLDISFLPMLNRLPMFGVMLDLTHFNVTGNRVTNVSVTNFVGLCNLRLFTNENLTMEFTNVCECERIDNWFDATDVKSDPVFTPRCELSQLCLEDTKPKSAQLEIHNQCTTNFAARENIRTISQICYIIFGTIGCLLLVVGVCYAYYRCQRLPDEDKSIKRNQSYEKTSLHLLMPNNNEKQIND